MWYKMHFLLILSSLMTFPAEPCVQPGLIYASSVADPRFF